MGELDLFAIGERIRKLRGNLTQAAFADRLGLERKTVGRYESGERAPDALALLRMSEEFGADPSWVLTGKGFEPSLSDDERQLLALFRSAPLAVKAATVAGLAAGVAPVHSPRYTVDFGNATIGQAIAGDVTNNKFRNKQGKDD